MRLPLGGRSAASRQKLRRLETEGLALRTEDPARALLRFQAVLAHDRDRVVSLRAMGRLLMKGRRYADARQPWERLARLVPDDPEPLVQLARIHRQSGRTSEAAALAARALRLAPHHEGASDLRSQLTAQNVPIPELPAPSASPEGLGSLVQLATRSLETLLPFIGRRQQPTTVTPAPATRSAAEILTARAIRQARSGNHKALANTIEALFGLEGPTAQVLTLIQAHREALLTEAPPWLDAVLAHADGEAPASEAQRRLLARARRQARANDGEGFKASLDVLFDLTGPTEALTALATEHEALVRATGDRRLIALLEAGESRGVEAQRRLLARARRQARANDGEGFKASLDVLFDLTGPTEALTALATEHEALVRATGDRRLIALLEAGESRGVEAQRRLLARARRQARANDGEGFKASLDVLFDLTGPTEALTALATEHEALVRATGDRRLIALLEAGESRGVEAQRRLLARARRQARANDGEGFKASLDVLFDLTGPTEALTALATEHEALVRATGDRRLIALLEAGESRGVEAQRRLLARARRQARANDGEGFKASLDVLFDLTGPTEALTALATEHEALVRATGDRRLIALLEAGESRGVEAQRRLLARARRQARANDGEGFKASLDVLFDLTGPTEALTALATEHEALVTATGDRRLIALLEAGESRGVEAQRRLLARARRQARANDGEGFKASLDVLFDLTGPTEALTALATEHEALVRATGDRRLIALLEAGDFSSAPQARLLSRARREGRAGDQEAFVATLSLLFDLNGPTQALTLLATEYAPLVEGVGDRRLMTLLDLAGSRRSRMGGKGSRRPAITDPYVDELLPKLAEAARDIEAISHLLEELSLYEFTDERVRELLADRAHEVLSMLEDQRGDMAAAELTAIEQRLAKTYGRDPWLIQALARQREIAGFVEEGLRLYDHLADHAADAAPALLHAATLACDLHEWDVAASYGRRATRAAPNDRRLLANLAALFTHHHRADDAVACWRLSDAQGSLRLWVKQGLVRALETAGDRQGLTDEVLRILHHGRSFADTSPLDHNYLVDIFRRLVQSQGRGRSDPAINEIAAALTTQEPPSALREWMLASLDTVRPDYLAALRRLDEGIASPPPMPGVALDLHAEKALIFQAYHLYGDALSEMSLAKAETVRLSAHYGRRFDLVRQVASLCPNATQPLLYPECLFDLLFEEIAGQPMRYEPQARHVVMVSGSLGQGGGERQTITVVRRILKDPRIDKLSLFVRSTHMRPTDDFFLSSVSELPVGLSIYGKAWERRSDIAATLPEFAGRARLVAALDLLPHNAREEVVRLCRLLLDTRPQAVHIWQDIPHAALACALVGAPYFFIHRGSLAPNFWGQTEHQTAVHFRPMRHAYRRLLERPDFVLLNNSISGCKTDQDWLNWPDPKPFQVVYNAVDFSQLGVNAGRNIALRHELGIPDDAPLIGGSFRIVAVKRPRYWIEAARQIRLAIPNAHFLIIGDGDMTEEVAEFAAARGFAEAVHLPGRVSNVGDWYRAMDLTLMTSEREGIPNAIIEAQHFGVPVIATDVGGIHEAIEIGHTGYVVPGEQGPTIYAEAVINVLRDAPWHDAARLRAPEFVHEKFSLDRVLDRLMMYYGINGAEAAVS